MPALKSIKSVCRRRLKPVDEILRRSQMKVFDGLLHAEGDEQITQAKTEATAMIAAAEVRYDNAMTALEADMKVALGA